MFLKYNFKRILLFFIIMHISFMVIIGLSSFSSFHKHSTKGKLNPIGKFLAKEISEYRFYNSITNVISSYAIFTGTNRGYSFFSPNVSNLKVKVLFVSKRGEEIKIPLKTSESFLKFGTVIGHFSTTIFNKKERDVILKSISSVLFSLHPDIDNLEVYLDLYEYPSLNNYITNGYSVSHKKVKAFSIEKINNYAL